MSSRFSLPHISLLSLLQCPEIRERDKSRQRRENEKDDRKLALVRRVVAKKNIITEKRWARRGRLLSLFGYLPLWICLSLLRCPEKRRTGTEGWGNGPRKWIAKRWARPGRQVQFLNVSHWSPVPSSMPGNERVTEKEESEREVSSSSDRGTRQRKRNCLHWQPMAIPASSLLNIKHKYNVRTQYVTIL